MAYKAVWAADTGAADPNQVKALPSGSYTFYWESSAPIGKPSAPTTAKPGGGSWKFQECLNACDEDDECAAVGMTKVTKATGTGLQADVVIGSCRLIKGVAQPGESRRSVTKANVNLLSLPAAPGELAQSY